MSGDNNKEKMQVATIERNKTYIHNLNKLIDFIEKIDAKPNKDRLRYANILAQLIHLLIASIEGWKGWFNFNTMDSIFTLEEFEKIVPKMKKIILSFIKVDLEITKAKTEDIEKEHKETKKTRKSKTYVS